MTNEIFRQDAYVFEFEAKVVSVNGDEVVLDSTAFYPGGGGQSCDTGTMRSQKVTEVFRKGSDIVHVVPKNNLNPGDMIWCSVDWDRRYDLMKGHTAEHLLFGSLQRFAPEIGIVKIFISPDSKYVIIDRDVEWDAIRQAVAFANKAIAANLTVSKSMMDKDDPEMDEVRMDPDKVKGDDVTVVEIGDVDSAACSGIHVMETEELGAIFVDRKVSAGKDGFAIHFKIGWDAIDSAMEMANTCIQVSEVLNSKPDDVIKAAANAKEQLDVSRKGMKTFISGAVRKLNGEEIGGVMVHSGVFPAAESKVFVEASERFRSSGKVSILVTTGTSISLFIASGSPKVDSGVILKNVLEKYNGRGGGKKEFAQGGAPNVDDAENILNDALSMVRESLS